MRLAFLTLSPRGTCKAACREGLAQRGVRGRPDQFFMSNALSPQPSSCQRPSIASWGRQQGACHWAARHSVSGRARASHSGSGGGAAGSGTLGAGCGAGRSSGRGGVRLRAVSRGGTSGAGVGAPSHTASSDRSAASPGHANAPRPAAGQRKAGRSGARRGGFTSGSAYQTPADASGGVRVWKVRRRGGSASAPSAAHRPS